MADKPRKRGLVDRKKDAAKGALPPEIPEHVKKWIERVEAAGGDGESTIVDFGDFGEEDDDEGDGW